MLSHHCPGSQAPQTYEEFERSIRALDHRLENCTDHIVSLRIQLEQAFASKTLTLHQWRLLWEDVSVVHARHAMKKPDAWRSPREEGLVLTYVPGPPALPKR